MLSVRLSGKGGLHTDSRWIIALRKRYERVLSWTALRHPLITALAIVPMVLVLTGVMIKITNFGPDTEGSGGMRRDNLYVYVDFADNVDKYVSEEAILVAQEYLEGRKEELGLNYIYSFYGAARGGISLFFEKGVISEDFYRDLRDDLRENLPVQAGVKYLFGNEDGTGSGVKTFNVTIYGEDTEYLYEKAETIKGLLGNLEGISDVRSDSEDDSREIRINVDNDAAGRFGISANTISDIMGLTYRGVMLPRLNTGTKEVDMIVSLDPADRESIENLAILTVGEANGQAVQLQQVADFEINSTPQRIQRTNRRSGVTIRGTYDGEELKDALDMVEQVMDQVPFPLGYGWSFGSDILRSQQQSSEMGLNMLLALACVFFVMASLFESLLHPLVVMACVPFASVGVFWIMMATGTPFSIMAMIGMVILIGIVVNNGIVLVDHVNHHRRHGLTIEDALMRACGERLRPILMTAGTTILGLMPLAVLPGAHVAGAEYYPMARAIIGGLASSTLLTLIVLPTYYLIADRYTVAFRATLRRMAVK
jgi:HAE1 family hydrophobic/amphiphilic exporter-1